MAVDTAGPGEARAFVLGEIVASVDRPVSEVAATVRVITASQIEETGARTLDEALQLLPGLNVRTGGQGVPRVDLRGLRARHVILLLNGIPLNSAFDGQFDPAFIPAEEIARIKVTTGTGSVLYGEGGLGGTINIITRAGGSDFSGEATGEVREVDGRMVSARAGGGYGGISAFVSGSASSVDGYPSVAGSPALDIAGTYATRRNSDRDRVNGMALVTAAPASGVELGFVAGLSRGAYGIPPTLIADPADPFARDPTFERVEDRDDGFARVAASVGAVSGVRLRSWAFVNGLDLHEARYDDSSYTSMADVQTRGTYDSRTRTRLSGLGLQVATAEGALGRLTLGLSGERDAWNLDLSIRDLAVGSKQNRTWGVRDFEDARTLARYGAALEYEVHPTNRIGFVAGYMHHWLRRDEAVDSAAVSVEGAPARTTEADGYMTALSFDAAAGTRLRVAVARKFRFPTIRQLYDEAAGNPALNTERADVVEAGVHQELPGLGLDATVFRMEMRDYIERPSYSEPFANYQRFRFTGVEVGVEARPIEPLTVRGSYTFMNAVDLSAEADRDELQYRPRHRAAFETRYAFGFGLRAMVSALHVAQQYYYSRQEPVEKAELPAFTLVGLRLTQDLPGRSVEVFAGADNLFNVAYEEEYGSPQATRALYFGARVWW